MSNLSLLNGRSDLIAMARTTACVLAVAALLCAGSAAFAVPIISKAGGGSCVLGNALGGGACTLQTIIKHQRYESNNPLGRGASWVSYDDTGWYGLEMAPPAGTPANPRGSSVIMSVFETFSFGELGGHLALSVWADDTAAVWLDGESLFAPNFDHPERMNFPVVKRRVQALAGRGKGRMRRLNPIGMDMAGACAQGQIGCEPGEQREFSEILGGGEHEIRIDVYQVGLSHQNNPFGVMYSGEALDNGGGLAGVLGDVSPMPEPSSALLFAIGAAVIGFGRRSAR
jgi:hypothetical protein